MSVKFNCARKGLLAVVLGFACALPVAAQNTTEPNTTTTTTPSATTTREDVSVRKDDDRSNWGWLGLLGFAGLFGLRRDRDTHANGRPHTAPAR
jgi:MYXO-CTERM domain-containing protein